MKKKNILKTQTEFNAYIIYVAHTLSICIGYLLFVNTTSSISTWNSEKVDDCNKLFNLFGFNFMTLYDISLTLTQNL